MPLEIEMFQRFMNRYRLAFSYLENSDDVTLFATLNLNPKLTDWDKSELSIDYFSKIFNAELIGIPSISNIVYDDSLWGTTQQKRECIELPYDQFIFVDVDIAVHEHLLKHQLNASYLMDGMYILSPSIPRWWDASWDVLVDSKFKDSPFGCSFNLDAFETCFAQDTDNISIVPVYPIKFGCGMHTLYSKSFWKFVGIPESFNGYGPEDTYGMFAANYANKIGYEIYQYRLDGIYIVEDYSENRIPTFSNKIVSLGNKEHQKSLSESFFSAELNHFASRI